jgi:hypothetical protein
MSKQLRMMAAGLLAMGGLALAGCETGTVEDDFRIGSPLITEQGTTGRLGGGTTMDGTGDLGAGAVDTGAAGAGPAFAPGAGATPPGAPVAMPGAADPGPPGPGPAGEAPRDGFEVQTTPERTGQDQDGVFDVLDQPGIGGTGGANDGVGGTGAGGDGAGTAGGGR